MFLRLNVSLRNTIVRNKNGGSHPLVKLMSPLVWARGTFKIVCESLTNEPSCDKISNIGDSHDFQISKTRNRPSILP